MGWVDIHNHLLPRVDDGAADLEESRAALTLMVADGVHTVAVTPHLSARVTERPEMLREALAQLEAAFEQLSGLVSSEFPSVRLARGVELMLDTPGADLSDPRVRLGGSPTVLVEFPGLMIPMHSAVALHNLRDLGWRPVLAHPERYRNLTGPEIVGEWLALGCQLQVNAGSLLGRYGPRAKLIAESILHAGEAAYVASDYHSRGRFPIGEWAAEMAARGGAEQARLLAEVNPSRLLNGEEPLPVPPLPAPPASTWTRLRSWIRRAV